MDYRALLVHIEPDSTSSDARLHLAASLAKRFSATLIGCSAAAIHPVPVGDPYSGAFVDGRLIEAEQEQIEASLEKAKDESSRTPRQRIPAAVREHATGKTVRNRTTAFFRRFLTCVAGPTVEAVPAPPHKSHNPSRPSRRFFPMRADSCPLET